MPLSKQEQSLIDKIMQETLQVGFLGRANIKKDQEAVGFLNRQVCNLSRNALTALPGYDPIRDVLFKAAAYLEAGVGNCHELSSYYYVRFHQEAIKADLSPLNLALVISQNMQTGQSHVYIIYGLSDADKRLTIEHWPDDALIIDPWERQTVSLAKVRGSALLTDAYINNMSVSIADLEEQDCSKLSEARKSFVKSFNQQLKMTPIPLEGYVTPGRYVNPSTGKVSICKLPRLYEPGWCFFPYIVDGALAFEVLSHHFLLAIAEEDGPKKSATARLIEYLISNIPCQEARLKYLQSNLPDHLADLFVGRSLFKEDKSQSFFLLTRAKRGAQDQSKGLDTEYTIRNATLCLNAMSKTKARLDAIEHKASSGSSVGARLLQASTSKITSVADSKCRQEDSSTALDLKSNIPRIGAKFQSD